MIKLFQVNKRNTVANQTNHTKTKNSRKFDILEFEKTIIGKIVFGKKDFGKMVYGNMVFGKTDSEKLPPIVVFWAFSFVRGKIPSRTEMTKPRETAN